MKSSKNFTTLFVVLFFLGQVQAQSQFSAWAASFNTIKLGEKTSFHFDGQFRSAAQVGDLQTILLRPGINFQLGKNLLLSGGYGFISNLASPAFDTKRVTEHRFWQQLIVSHKLGHIATGHRFRVEQRLIPKVDERAYASRFRYFVRNILPLEKSERFSKGLYMALQNEVFLNFGNTSVVNGKTFDQNRFYLATGHRLHPNLDLEIGYMNQYVDRGNTAFTNSHILQVASYLRL